MTASTVGFPVATEQPGGTALIATDQVDLGAGAAEVTYGKIVDGTTGGTTALKVGADGSLTVHDVAAPVGFGTANAAALATAAALPALPGGAVVAIMSVEGGTVRYRHDGSTSAPTTSTGMPVRDGGTVSLPFGATALGTLRVIAASGSPSIMVTYL